MKITIHYTTSFGVQDIDLSTDGAYNSLSPTDAKALALRLDAAADALIAVEALQSATKSAEELARNLAAKFDTDAARVADELIAALLAESAIVTGLHKMTRVADIAE